MVGPKLNAGMFTRGSPSWAAPAVVRHCLALGDASSPAELTGRNRTARSHCRGRCSDALAGSHSSPCPMEESEDHPPPTSSWREDFSQRKVPLGRFRISGACSYLPWATSGHGREKIQSGKHCCNFWTAACLSITARVRSSSGSSVPVAS